MILSVSRRTDIPALYSDRFFEVLKAGEVLVPNPFIKDGKTAKITLVPIKKVTNLFGVTEVTGTLEGIVFWSKNPQPILARIDELNGIVCYFQYTLNPYSIEYESNLPALDNRIQTFIALAKRCPVVWRYDPIFLSKSITVNWHLEQFEILASKLAGSTDTCMINTLIGRYKDAYCPNASETEIVAEGFAKIGKQYGIEIKACAEIISLEKYGIKRGKCVDPAIFEGLLNAKLKPKYFGGGASRKNCLCMPSIDIGVYNTCTNGCVYCYAKKDALKQMSVKPAVEIYERKVERVFDY